MQKQTGRELILWPGSCMVHELFSEKKLVQLKVLHPDAQVIAHPECEEAVLKLADVIGSTKQLLEHAVASPCQKFIVVTEAGIIHQMQAQAPGKQFIPAPPDNGCACNECPHMRLNTVEKLYRCMKRPHAPARAAGRPAPGRAGPAAAHARVELKSTACTAPPSTCSAAPVASPAASCRKPRSPRRPTIFGPVRCLGCASRFPVHEGLVDFVADRHSPPRSSRPWSCPGWPAPGSATCAPPSPRC